MLQILTSIFIFMVALGCIQALQCIKNTCPTGITTHDRKLQRGLVPEDKAERVRRYSETMRDVLWAFARFTPESGNWANMSL